jgi:hypothetical protein
MLTVECEKKISEKRKKKGGWGRWLHMKKAKDPSSMVCFSPFLHTTNSKVFALFARCQNIASMTTPMTKFLVVNVIHDYMTM